jgi:hypothetical protein
MPDVFQGAGSVTITLDPGNRIEEITEQNNTATIPLVAAPAS